MSFLGNLKETVEQGKNQVNQELDQAKDFNSQGTGFEQSPLGQGLFGEEQKELNEKEEEDEDPRVRIDIY